MSLIEIKNLTHIYSKGTALEYKALDNVSLNIEKGEFIGIIGHTGSGKSTLIKHMNALLKPICGKVIIDGVDIFLKKETIQNIKQKVGIVFQYPEYQLFEQTVYKDIAFGPSNMGLNDYIVNQKVLKAIDFISLKKEFLNRSPFELSGGEKRKAAIAGVIAMDPEILILDEPSAGLDPISKEGLFSNIKKYHKKQGNTVILVSHNMQDVAMLSDKIVVMNNGKVCMFDTPQNIFKQANVLEDIGLCVPDITKIMLKIKNKGFDVNTNVYTIEDALKSIEKLLK